MCGSAVHVRYDNGLQITANQREEPLSVNGHVLDRFGWLAEGAGVTAWTARRNGTIADFAETSDRVFANARASSDWNLSATKRIRPVVSRFEAFGPREIKFTYGWQVHDVLSRDFACFVHFGRAGASELEILLQQDHVPTVPTSQWKPEQTIQDGPYTLTIPGKLPNGDYAWTIGLFRTGESRVALEGPTDGSARILLGTLRIKDGNAVEYVPNPDSGAGHSAIYLEHLNQQGTIVDFGPVRTNGSILVERDGAQWVARTFPRDRTSSVLLSRSRFGQPGQVQCVGGQTPVATAVSEGTFWRLPMNKASEYRWDAQ